MYMLVSDGLRSESPRPCTNFYIPEGFSPWSKVFGGFWESIEEMSHLNPPRYHSPNHLILFPDIWARITLLNF